MLGGSKTVQNGLPGAKNRDRSAQTAFVVMSQRTEIKPTSEAWEASALPLNYALVVSDGTQELICLSYSGFSDSAARFRRVCGTA